MKTYKIIDKSSKCIIQYGQCSDKDFNQKFNNWHDPNTLIQECSNKDLPRYHRSAKRDVTSVKSPTLDEYNALIKRIEALESTIGHKGT